MATKNKNPVEYQREKGKMKISGEADTVKKHIWFDQINTTLLWVVPVIILLCVLPKVSWLPVILQWLKKFISLWIFFVAVQGFDLLFLSG